MMVAMRGGWLCALGALVLLHCKVDDVSGVPSNVALPTGVAGMPVSPMMPLGSGGQVAAPPIGTSGMGMSTPGANTSMNGTGGSGTGGTPAMTGTGGTPVINHGPPTMDAGMMMDVDAGHDTGMTAAGDGETGRLVGITAAHNAVRAMVDTQPPLPPLMWSPEVAAYAQQWADMLALTCNPQHRDGNTLQQKGYGENLAASFSTFSSPMTTAQWAVDGWAAEKSCWMYGTINSPQFGGGTEKCDIGCYSALNSDGCGHYTQIVWRDSTELGCGFSTCMMGGTNVDIWICNYAPAGNYVGEAPY